MAGGQSVQHTILIWLALGRLPGGQAVEMRCNRSRRRLWAVVAVAHQ
jgi:hypothetical protein